MAYLVVPKVESKESTNTYGSFVVEPLDKGFGITLGNSLRRVLLGSLLGCAVTKAQIDGVVQEFSTIEGVKEDTTELLLNIKQIRIRSLSNKAGKMVLDVKGPGIVTAADIEPTIDFEVVNPELKLAQLAPDARLHIEFTVEQGKGYQPATDTDGLTIGVLRLDAIFTPVRRVNYKVEPSGSVEGGSYERLILEIWTDATITPAEALSQSARILREQLEPIGNFSVVAVQVEKAPQQLAIPPEQYNVPLEQLKFSPRTYNCLRRSNITKLGELAEKTDKELLGMKRLGQKSLEEIHRKLSELGLRPAEEEATEEGEGVEKLKSFAELSGKFAEGGEEADEGEDEDETDEASEAEASKEEKSDQLAA